MGPGDPRTPPAMWTRSLLAVSCSLAAVQSVLGHGYIAFPPMRGGTSGSGGNAYCPQCGNGAGVCGDGGQWGGSSDFLGQAGPWTRLVAGDVVEFVIVVTAHHRGHFEFGICDQQLGHSTADAQGCVDKHKLLRAPPPSDCVPNDARGDCQPVHEQYPERWYLPPGTGTHRMRFVVPSDLSCSSCTLQWRWWTANSCIPAPDYGCYFSRMRALGWDAAAWCGSYCGSCSGSLLESNVSSVARHEQTSARGCGEEFRNCADVEVRTSGSPGPSPPRPTPVPSPAPSTSSPAPSLGGACVRNEDCATNAWCGDVTFDTWCPSQGTIGECPAPQCVRGSSPSPTTTAPAGTTQPGTPSLTPTPSTTTVPVPSPGTGGASTCVSRSAMVCINDYSRYWPKCSPEQTKSNAGPAGYEFGYYCDEAWAAALNEMLADPAINKCDDSEAIHKLLAQVTYETGYLSTVYQPLDGGAGLIHMIPGNWPVNARDMDAIWPGRDFAGKAAAMGKNFFQTPAYGWRSVAAWFKRTNGVIGGCGMDLFAQSFQQQTQCILGSPSDRSEAYEVVRRCLELNPPGTGTAPPSTTMITDAPSTTAAVTIAASTAAPTPAPGPATTQSSSTLAPTAPSTTTPSTTPPSTSAPAASTTTTQVSASGACEQNRDCGSNPWCRDAAYSTWCRTQGATGWCPFPQCVQASGGTRKVRNLASFLGPVLMQRNGALGRAAAAAVGAPEVEL